MIKHALILALSVSATLALAAPNKELPVAKVAQICDSAQCQTAANAALQYAAFWHSGDTKFARQALSNAFTDMTLPRDRKQGLKGVLEASSGFRRAVPDLKAEVEHLLVSGSFVTVRLRFFGHFSGQFGEHQGAGQAIDFRAVDVYYVDGEKITKNWHLEDYHTLFEQMQISE
ncbi:ester cyclase [Pseudoalteromonas sp. S2755]|uniref:ester cyclase n=1 Tax=Pseudoalteromonas sp. S2755 TaxID=2066523 RepID=UPI00110A1EB8|nr:ester cyclase [Pseudoalteromonas sp. S2755]TMN32663.1 ester cyclase [Pseudoalteromonas sp. S2755]